MLENTLQNRAWWNQLEPQWRKAFGMAVLKHTEEPDDADLEMLFKIETIRMAGPAASFPNMRIELTNLSGLAHLCNLKIVIITHHHVQSIEEVSCLKNLKSLFLFNKFKIKHLQRRWDKLGNRSRKSGLQSKCRWHFN